MHTPIPSAPVVRLAETMFDLFDHDELRVPSPYTAPEYRRACIEVFRDFAGLTGVTEDRDVIAAYITYLARGGVVRPAECHPDCVEVAEGVRLVINTADDAATRAVAVIECDRCSAVIASEALTDEWEPGTDGWQDLILSACGHAVEHDVSAARPRGPVAIARPAVPAGRYSGPGERVRGPGWVHALG